MSPKARYGRSDAFPSTHWSAVLAAGRPGTPGGDQALAELCQAYWYPLYAYARRMGQCPVDAEDLTQGFFAHLVKRGLVGRVDASKGRFRAFLLGAFRNYMLSERDKAAAQKRGGGRPLLSLDTRNAETRFAAELSTTETPERMFDRLWALTVLDQALQLLADEHRQAGRSPLFERLHPLLQGEHPHETYAQIAHAHHTTADAIKVRAYRMRQRYRELVRLVILHTVSCPTQVDGELHDLLGTLRPSG